MMLLGKIEFCLYHYASRIFLTTLCRTQLVGNLKGVTNGYMVIFTSKVTTSNFEPLHNLKECPIIVYIVVQWNVIDGHRQQYVTFVNLMSESWCCVAEVWSLYNHSSSTHLSVWSGYQGPDPKGIFGTIYENKNMERIMEQKQPVVWLQWSGYHISSARLNIIW